MHIHLDPIGGMAGDMFAAAILDAWPELEVGLVAALAAAGLDRVARVARVDHRDDTMTGSRFSVEEVTENHHHDHHHDHPDEAHHHHHHHHRDIRALLERADLPAAVRERALDIFALLARAEAKVHGVDEDDVSFHEVGAWDSIADIVSAAWLIDALGSPTWSSTPLPMGRGRVTTAHGNLPVPAPATAELLEGFPLVQDEHLGERVTPTGAAIVRHIAPRFEAVAGAMTLGRIGTGFGTRTFEGMSNIVRLLAFEHAPTGHRAERVCVAEFEVDDQTAEDLAIALDRLRALDGVADVSQMPVHGKKGRIATGVRLLCAPRALATVLDACFDETTTLGIRHHEVHRAVLERSHATVDVDGGPVRVKSAVRPGEAVTRKADIDDVAAAGGHAARERARASAEGAAHD